MTTGQHKILAYFAFAALFAANSQGQQAIESRKAKIEGETIHYLHSGKGSAVILLHGYTQTSEMWRALMPKLSARFSVIAPDLPGIGGSDIPAGSMDMAAAAGRIHALAKSWAFRKPS
ncbi:MAG: alpha/beta fold hydrolase [Acidobacteriota bacterium]